MLMTGTAILMILTAGTPSDVGYEPLLEGRDAAAVEEIQANTELAPDDPVKLINLGIAYARQGRTEEAREMFEEAMRGSDRLVLETADGEWKDSRHLARLALEMLNRGDFRTGRMAAR